MKHFHIKHKFQTLLIGVLLLGSFAAPAARGIVPYTARKSLKVIPRPLESKNIFEGSPIRDMKLKEAIEKLEPISAADQRLFLQALLLMTAFDITKKYNHPLAEKIIIEDLLIDSQNILHSKEWDQNGARGKVLAFLNKLVFFSKTESFLKAFKISLMRNGLANQTNLRQRIEEMRRDPLDFFTAYGFESSFE